MATPVAQRHALGRSAARKAAAACEEQLMSSETEEHGDSPFGHPSPSRNRGKTKVTYKSKGKRSPVQVRKSSPIAPPAPKTPSGRKRRMSPSISDNGASDPLSPLSSCGWSTPVMQTPTKKSPVRAQASHKSSPSRVHGLRKGGATMSTPTSSFIGSGKKAVEEPWEAAKLGSFVWVLVDKRTRVVEEDGDYSPHIMWWPARITSPRSNSVPLLVSLIGERIPSTPNTMELTSPSEQNILSMLNASGELRFSETNFIVSSTHDPLQSSPRKKKKRDVTDIESKWRAAVEDLVHQHDDANDGLPQAGEAYGSFYGNTLSPRKAKNSPTKAERPFNLDHMEDATVDPWLPPTCDPTLTIPGELILAREKKDSKAYWPAKIEAYVPPDKPSKPGRYSIVFFDTVQSVIPRGLFFTSDEDGFGTCNLGKWESSYEDVLNDKESQQVDEDNMQDSVRSPSPPSIPPSSSDEFCHLSIPQQFSFVKPILISILHEGYVPAKQRHFDFIKGGAFRQGVTENAGARGMMSPADVEELQRCLLKWALRDERRAKRMVDDEMPDNEPLTLEGRTKSHEASEQLGNSVPSKPKEVDDGTSVSPMPSPLTSMDESEVAIPFSQPEIPPSSSEPSSPPRTNGSVQESDLLLNTIRPEAESSRSRHENAAGDRRDPDIVDGFRPSPRQRGCEAYEGLSEVERIEYCSNVLLPEAVLQLLLWRSGERSSVELLSPEEEAALHEISTRKSEETDWVHDVVRLREAKVRSLRKLASSLPASATSGGTRSRPKRMV